MLDSRNSCDNIAVFLPNVNKPSQPFFWPQKQIKIPHKSLLGLNFQNVAQLRKNYAHKVAVYERLANLLTRRLLGDRAVGPEIDTVFFCEEALGKERWN